MQRFPSVNSQPVESSSGSMLANVADVRSVNSQRQPSHQEERKSESVHSSSQSGASSNIKPLNRMQTYPKGSMGIDTIREESNEDAE